LKELSSAILRDQIASFLFSYYLERGDNLNSYNSDLLAKDPIKRLASLAKLLPNGEDPTASPLPKSSNLKEFALAPDSKDYSVSLGKCLDVFTSNIQFGNLLGHIIVKSQLDGIGKFRELKAKETLELLARVKGPDYTVSSKVDIRDVSKEPDQRKG
jgi:hypothetical protein